MRVLIIQENGRHEKNRHFRECFSIQRSFTKLGHEAHVWGLGHQNYKEEINYNSYDLIINLENYDTTGWVPDLSNVKTKKFLWVIDAHCRGMKPYTDTFNSGKYDLILQSTKDYLDKNSVWLPNACDSTLFYPREVEKNIKFGFCGSVLNRQQILDFLTQKYDLKQNIWVIGEEMVKLISSFKIAFNLNLANDINYRSFETISCGTALLTNFNSQYLDLGFVDEENCLLYKNVEELCSKIENYIVNDEKILKISKNALELSKRHTYDARIKNIIGILNE